MLQVVVLCFCLVFSFYPLQVTSQDDEYTWEDYDGTIPEKALLASDDANNPVYVGMAKVGEDNCIGTLNPGATEIMVECKGVQKANENLKILTVNDPTKFKWLETNVGLLEKVTLKGLVEAVKINNWYVGRTTTDDGTLEVGHISSGKFYYIHDNKKEKKFANYEVLVINKSPKESISQHEGYTWENYDGTVSEKAFSVSDDAENPVYVGMGMVNEDNCTGSLLPNAAELTVFCSNYLRTLKDNIKILIVEDKTKFKWIQITAKDTWKEKTDGEDLIVSNFNQEQGIYWYVGRETNHDGTDAGQLVDGIFYYAHENAPSASDKDYEVLAYIKEEAD